MFHKGQILNNHKTEATFLDDTVIKAREQSKVVIIFQSSIAIEKITIFFYSQPTTAHS